MTDPESLSQLESEWKSNPRWEGVTRPYKAADVEKLRGSIQIEHTLARLGSERLWNLLHEEPCVLALGTLTGNQAVQQVKAGLQAIYVSGWQVAADANGAGQVYPDQSLYPVDSVPNLVRSINQALVRADQIHHSEGDQGTRVVCSTDRRWRGGFRRQPEYLRTHEGDDRRGRRMRSL